MLEKNQNSKVLRIGPVEVSDKSPTFIIAEIGNNHNGSFERAIELVNLAVEAGANCVKFQMRHMQKVYRKKSLARGGDDLSTEYTIDLLNRMELTLDEHRRVAEYCRDKNIFYLCTPWDQDSVDVLESFAVQAYKVASADLTNFPLIEYLAKTKKPLILSTGMNSYDEIRRTVEFLNSKKAQFAILHCNSTYPAPFASIQLNFIKELKKLHPFVGYSGHERGTAVSIGAVALGARIVERHFTLDRHMEGPDHAASLEPKDFKALVDGIRQVEVALGDEGIKTVSQGEMINRENLGKSVVAARPLRKGSILKRDDLEVRSPGRGLSPQYLDQLIGLSLKRDIEEEDFFYMSDLNDDSARARAYKFHRPWGIPVRYHDFAQFAGQIHPDLFEFHLSYTDMEHEPSEFFSKPFDCDFVVHAPELFAGSRLMDLATPDGAYRAKSLEETQRVIDITRALKPFFPKTKRPLIVANIGGFSMDAPFPEKERAAYYDRFAQSLKQLDLDGVELIPQTMAPFPWHFGGQRYQNLFVFPDEMVSVCRALGLRICFDISHCKLTATHFGIDFGTLVETLAPITAHLHVSDSKGVDGEGLQVGDGEIDFKQVASILDRLAPQASFIPEVWQGHKNAGEGFWLALERLEKWF